MVDLDDRHAGRDDRRAIQRRAHAVDDVRRHRAPRLGGRARRSPGDACSHQREREAQHPARSGGRHASPFSDGLARTLSPSAPVVAKRSRAEDPQRPPDNTRRTRSGSTGKCLGHPSMRRRGGPVNHVSNRLKTLSFRPVGAPKSIPCGSQPCFPTDHPVAERGDRHRRLLSTSAPTPSSSCSRRGPSAPACGAPSSTLCR